MTLDHMVIGAYLLAMVGIGVLGGRLAKNKSDFLVAGRRLGTTMYAGTMSAVVLGGASTIGGVALGYKYGISGSWLVISIGLGILALSLFLAKRIVRSHVYTVSELVDLRYGGATSMVSGIVMVAYTLMLAVTSTVAYATIFGAVFGLGKALSIVLGGSVVVLYSVLGGMWSVTLTDIVQFAVKTVGVLFILLPIVLWRTGGFGGLSQHVPDDFFDFTAIGSDRIIAYLLTYTLGLLIGQDIWQRVFTARSDRVAFVGGISCGVYCVLYGLGGAIIGMAARGLLPGLSAADDAFAAIVNAHLPAGLRGLVLAAALAALMSTSSGALIACATVTANDIWKRGRHESSIHGNRIATAVLGIVMIAAATLFHDVITALTVAYNLLAGGLSVTIIGALFWPRATRRGALLSMSTGSLAVLVCMIIFGIESVVPIYCGLAVSAISYIVGSLLTPAPDLTEWDERLGVRT